MIVKRDNLNTQTVMFIDDSYMEVMEAFDNGFFSNTGWGDGSYETYKYTLEDKVVGLKVIFMED